MLCETYTFNLTTCFLLFKLKCIPPDIAAAIRFSPSEELGAHGWRPEITVSLLVED